MFVYEVVGALSILASLRVIDEVERSQPAPHLDWVGSVLSAVGLGLEVSVRASGGVDFVATDAVAERARDAGLDDETTAALIESYAAAQLMALKAGLLAALGLAAGALTFTRHLPATRPRPDQGTDSELVAPIDGGAVA